MKRLFLIFFLGVVVMGGLLSQWQPDFLKERVLNRLARFALRSAPIDVVFGRVSGNLFKHVTVAPLDILSKSTHESLWSAKSVALDYSPIALLRRTLQLNHLTIILPDGRALFDGRVEAKQIPTDRYRVTMDGKLGDGPLKLIVLWGERGLHQADGEWASPKYGTASAHLADGEGPFHVHTGFAGFAATIDGKANLRKRLVQGTATAKKIVWQGKRADRLAVDFSITPEHQRLDAVITNFRAQLRGDKPFDIVSGHLTVLGRSPEWAATSTLQFRNGSTAASAGTLVRGEDFWRYTWSKLLLEFPVAGAWTSQFRGSATWRAQRPLEVRRVKLASGLQTLEIPNAALGGDETRFSLTAQHINPTPWTKLFWPELSLDDALLDASLHVNGTPKQAKVEGFFTGKVRHLEYTPMGLVVDHVEIDIRGVDRRLEIRRFTGKTKKGDIQITGASTWPNLDYQLHARDLLIRIPPSIKGSGDVDCRLRGTVESPELTGQLTVKEAVYTLPKEKEKKTPPPVAAAPAPAPVPDHPENLWGRTVLDFRAQWPRNVWYRDGVTGIETNGDIRVQKSKFETSPRLTGTITSIRGSYNYFGRDFSIDSGQIQFAGTPEVNPLLNVEASYRGEAAVVYLDITGTLTHPTLKLRSNPPLPEQDIISVIVFGRPLNELRSRNGGQTSNQEMMQAVGGVLGSYVTKELRQTGIAELHVDVLNLQPTSQGSQLTVGRYLGRKLFVSYGQSIRGSAEKSITADYFLTDKWTMQGASDSSQGNTLDFLFRYPLKKGSPTNAAPLPASPFRRTLDPSTPLQPGFGR